MNEHEPLQSLQQQLGGGGESSRPLVFSKAWTHIPGSPEFWQDASQAADFQRLADALAARATGSGLLVSVTDASPNCAQRQFAGLQLARLLNQAGKRVLLIDAERSGQGFSQSFDETEAEGLIDLILYGSSPMATVQPSPILGLWMMGAGSFPNDQELDGEAIHHAFSQLRGTHEVVILSMPAHQGGGEFSELLVHVDGVVFCAAGASSATMGELIEHLRSQGVPLWGAVSFGDAESLRDAVAEKPAPPAAPPKQEAAAPTPPQPARPAPEPRASRPSKPAAPAQPAAKPVAPAERPRPRAQPQPAAAAVEEEAPLRRHPSARGGRRSADDSSPLFRRALAAIVIVFVGFLGWWGFTQFRGAGSAEPERVARRPPVGVAGTPENVATPENGPARGPTASEADDTAAGTDDGNSVPGRDPAGIAAPETQPSQIAMSRRTPPAQEPTRTPTERVEAAPQQQNGSPEPTPVRDTPQQPPAQEHRDEIVDDAADDASATGEAEQQKVEPASSALERALRAEPGGGNWSLHLWSFRRATEAEVAARGLEREGLSPRIVEADLNELGHWYRVVVGRYERRGDASSARALMATWPGVEHIGLVRVP